MVVAAHDTGPVRSECFGKIGWHICQRFYYLDAVAMYVGLYGDVTRDTLQ